MPEDYTKKEQDVQNWTRELDLYFLTPEVVQMNLTNCNKIIFALFKIKGDVLSWKNAQVEKFKNNPDTWADLNTFKTDFHSRWEVSNQTAKVL